MLQARRRAAALQAGLNGVFTITPGDVAATFARMANHKAAGFDGLPSECLKYVQPTAPPTGGGTAPPQRPVYLLADLCARLFNRIIATEDYPEDWCTTLVSAIYKGKGSKLDPNNYRGIAVQCALAKCFAAVLERRISQHLEGQHLRSPFQSGFRQRLGTQNNLLVLKHLQARYCFPEFRGSNEVCYVCFIDFVKAFDKVQRQLMWERARCLGFEGKLLAALQFMYRKVSMRVKLGGRMGAVFDSLMGVKQGDPLSPVLFGMLIEVLPEFLRFGNALSHRHEGWDMFAGCPDLDGMVLFCMLFADDLTLISTDRQSMQGLLSLLAEFCDTFSFEVNISKSEMLVLHARQGPNMQHEVFHFGTHPLRVVEEARYLGVMFHQHGTSACCAEALVAAGHRAKGALIQRLAQWPALSPELKLRLFDAIVRPILTYGSQVWGVDYLHLPAGPPTSRSAPLVPDNPFEPVLIAYLRWVCGVGKSVPLWCLYQECSADYMQVHIVGCVLRFWNAVRRLPGHASYHAMREDLRLMLKGNRQCWTHKVCAFLYGLGLVAGTYKPLFVHPYRTMFYDQAFKYFWEELVVDVGAVCGRLRDFWRQRVLQVVEGLSPRTCPTDSYPRISTYVHWSSLCPATLKRHRHLAVCRPNARVQSLLRFRLGAWHKLAVNAGRFGSSHQPRAERVCMHCNTGGMEDELHVLFECPAYEEVRQRYPLLFTDNVRASMDAPAVLTSEHSADLVDCIHAMYRIKERAMQALAS
jgi:Reverse transcriptase (RNA-dependent DNA polymerase)